jgi:elongation factor G
MFYFHFPLYLIVNCQFLLGVIVDTETLEESIVIQCDVPLNDMFGYMSELRGMTQGKGEFTMEYKQHAPVLPSSQEDIIKEYLKTKKEGL